MFCFHRWTKWSEPYKKIIVWTDCPNSRTQSGFDETSKNMQERACLKCNKVERRNIK